MTDPLRADRLSRPGEVPDRERDARIEELLLTGLDHYFAGQHERAISVWSRVLFLDRGHARARAYIDRARGALSERQREADELFHTGAAALERGDRAAARQLLTSAVEQGTAGEEALVLLHHLDRLEAAALAAGAASATPPARAGEADRAAATRQRDPRLAWVAAGIGAGIVIAAVAVGYLWIVADPFELDGARRTMPPAAEEPLPVPAPCEIRLMRARELFAKGQNLEALTTLEPGDADDRHRAAYDALRAAIQRKLLDAGTGPATPSVRPHVR